MTSDLVNSNKEHLIVQNMLWSLGETQNALSQSSFVKVPNEIILYIFRFLSVPDICNVSLVCRSFKMIGDQDELWKRKSNTTIKLPSKSYRQIYIEWMHEKSLRNKLLLEHQRGYIYRTACYYSPPPQHPRRPSDKYSFQSIGGFIQHPNSTQHMTIKLSVDIDKTAPQLILLLEKASTFKEQWQQPVILKQMIQRYYRFMQLKALNPSNMLLIPTLDIEIVWQTHLLRPEIYRKDCLRLFGRVIDHSLILKDEIQEFFKEQAFLDICELYEQRFREKYCVLPSIDEQHKATSGFRNRHCLVIDDDDDYADVEVTCSYWDKTHFEFSSNPPNDYENPFSFVEGDIILDLKWFDSCKEFMSKAVEKAAIPDVHFYGLSSLVSSSGPSERLKKSYERFLYMAAKYSLKDGNGFIPPTYAIDIIWHSHMQEPLNYESDCIRLVGYVIYHDPWPVVEDEKMKKSCDKVDQIWKDEFQCEIEIDHLYNTSDNRDEWFG